MTAHHDETQGRKYETRDAHFPRVMTTAFSLLGVMVVGLAFAWGVYEIFTTQISERAPRTETFTVPDTANLPPAPNLEADPSVSLSEMRSEEDAMLTSYGWTDSARGIARVPVARAMELYLEQEHRR